MKSDVERGNTRGWPKNHLQYALCQGIVVDGLENPEAARKAGYAESTVDKKLYIIVKELAPYLAHLREAKKEVLERNWDVTVDRVVEELVQIGYVNPKDYIRVVMYRDVPMIIGKPLDELTDKQASAIANWHREKVVVDGGYAFDYRYQFYDKRQALADMGKHLGMFNDKLILEQRITKTYKVDLSQVPDEVLEKWMEELRDTGGRLPDPSRPATIDNDSGAVT